MVGRIFFFMAFFFFTGEDWILTHMPPHRQFFILLLISLIGPVFGTIGEALTYGYMLTRSFMIPILFGYGLVSLGGTEDPGVLGQCEEAHAQPRHRFRPIRTTSMFNTHPLGFHSVLNESRATTNNEEGNTT
jgi:hypothetical protein